MRIKSALTAALLLLAAFVEPAIADFYKGKTITMIVNFGPGSGPDTIGRLVAKHLSNHLPGTPNIIVQNIAGAGGLNGQNNLGLTIGGAPDGTRIGFFQVSTIAAIIDDPAARVPIYDLTYIGAISGQVVVYARKDIPPGLKRSADIAKSKSLFAGGFARSAPADVRFRLTLDVLGVPYRIVTGFAGSASITTALLRNEVNMASATVPVYLRSIVPQLVDTGIAIPLWYVPTLGETSEPVRNSFLESIGFEAFTEVYKQAYGKSPSGPTYHALMLMNDAAAQMSQGLFAPAETPAAATRELRQAWDALKSDSEFLSAYRRLAGAVDPAKAEFLGPDFITPEEAKQVFSRIRAISPEAKSIVRKAVSGN